MKSAQRLQSVGGRTPEKTRVTHFACGRSPHQRRCRWPGVCLLRLVHRTQSISALQNFSLSLSRSRSLSLTSTGTGWVQAIRIQREQRANVDAQRWLWRRGSGTTPDRKHRSASDTHTAHSTHHNSTTAHSTTAQQHTAHGTRHNSGSQAPISIHTR